MFATPETLSFKKRVNRAMNAATICLGVVAFALLPVFLFGQNLNQQLKYSLLFVGGLQLFACCLVIALKLFSRTELLHNWWLVTVPMCGICVTLYSLLT